MIHDIHYCYQGYRECLEGEPLENLIKGLLQIFIWKPYIYVQNMSGCGRRDENIEKKEIYFWNKNRKNFPKFFKKFFRNFYDYNPDMCLLLQPRCC